METERLLLDEANLDKHSLSINDADKLPPKPSFYVRQRVIICILLFLGLAIVYFLRVNLSVAIIPMSQDYHWSETVEGIFLSSFFWGYLITQVPGSMVAKKFGGKVSFSIAIVGASLFSALLPLVSESFVLMVICRILTGLFEALSYPTVHHLISQWLPDNEKSQSVGFVWSGAYAGVIAANMITPWILHLYNWHAIFYFSGILGLLWYLFWQLVAADEPSRSRWISNYEVYIIKKGLPPRKHATETLLEIPWKKMFSAAPVWALVINNFCGNWGFYVLLTWLPTYMKKELRFELDKDGGLFIILPYLVLLVISISAGRIADFMLSKGYDRKLVRSIFQCGATAVPAFFLSLLCIHANTTQALIFMMFAVGFYGCVVAGAGSNFLDIAPEHAGVVVGISNTVGTIPGIVGVTVTGFILDKTGSWCFVFLLAALVMTIGAIVWVIWSSGKRVI